MMSPNSVFLNKYEIIKLIGEGGMSKVYLAKDLSLNKLWAIKEIDKTSKAFRASVNADGSLTEVEILKRLDHPFAPRVVDIAEDDYAICVVMDYIEGESLQSVLDRDGAVEQSLAAKYCLDVSKLLYYLHKKGIIYRDIKPSNIILTKEGGIKVIDFGIAKVVRSGIYSDSISLGTKGYAPPEQSRRYSDERSDIYALGITLYQLLTGTSPVKQGFKIENLSNINPSLSTGLNEIVKRATEKDAKLRYQNTSELIDALSNYKKLETRYIKRLHAKVYVSKALRVISALLILLGILVLGTGVLKDSIKYRRLISTESVSQTERVDSFKEAIELFPYRAEGYIAITDEYSKEGLSMNEAEELMQYYVLLGERNIIKNKNFYDAYYAFGEALLVNYKGLSDYETKARLKLSGPYFEAAAEGCTKKELSICLANIYTFYEAYEGEDPPKESAEALLSSVKGLMLYSDSYIGKGSTRIKLMLYGAGLDIIDDYYKKIIKAGVDKNSLSRLGTEFKSKIEGFIVAEDDAGLSNTVLSKAEKIIKK